MASKYSATSQLEDLGAVASAFTDDYSFNEDDYYCDIGYEEELFEEEPEAVPSESGSEEGRETERVKLNYRILTCDDEAHRKRRLDIPGNDPRPEIWECQADPCQIPAEDLGSPSPRGAIVINPVETQLAYGDLALERLNRELKGADDDVRQIGSIMLADYLHDPENAEKAFNAGILNTLRYLLFDKQPIVREKAADCFRIIASHPIGRYALLQINAIAALANRFDDSHEIARKNTHRALERLAENEEGAQAMVRGKLVGRLLQRFSSETEDIQKIILDTLHFCFLQDPEQALKLNAMLTFKDYLNNSSNDIRWKTARNILDLSVPLKGKKEACKADIIAPLTLLLSDENACVRAKAAGALMMITIITEGKHMAITSGAVEPLLELLGDLKFEVRLNAIKALTNISEAPVARELLIVHIPKFQLCLEDSNPSVQAAAKIAIKVIQWKP